MDTHSDSAPSITAENAEKTVTFRHHAAMSTAGMVGTLGMCAVASAQWWLLPLFALPSAFTWWSMHSYTMLGADGVWTRGWWRKRYIPWEKIVGISVTRRFRLTPYRVHAVLDNGVHIVLPVVSQEAAQHITRGGDLLTEGASTSS